MMREFQAYSKISRTPIDSPGNFGLFCSIYSIDHNKEAKDMSTFQY